MAIHHWHPLKLGIIWLIDLAIFPALWLLASSKEEDQALVIIIWLIFSIPAFVLTWKWADGEVTIAEKVARVINQDCTNTSDKEYRIYKIKLPKPLLDEGVLLPITYKHRIDLEARFEWNEEECLEPLLVDIEEGWEMLSLSPFNVGNAEQNQEELTFVVLLARSYQHPLSCHYVQG